MFWVLLFVGIAVVGMATVAAYGVWLAHKTSDVMSEVAVLGDLLDRFGGLASEITMPPAPGGPGHVGGVIVVDGTRYAPVVDVG